MKYLIRRIIFWGLVLGLGIGAAYILIVGPDFSDYMFQEGPRHLDGTPYRGFTELWDEAPRIVIQVYWKVNCQYCKKQLELMKQIHSDEIFVVGINIGDSQRAVERVVNEVQPNYPIMLGVPDGVAVDSTGRPLQATPYNILITETEAMEWYGYGIDPQAEAIINEN